MEWVRLNGNGLCGVVESEWDVEEKGEERRRKEGKGRESKVRAKDEF